MRPHRLRSAHAPFTVIVVVLCSLISLLSISALGKTFAPPLTMVVKTSVANVRAKPVAARGDYAYDPLQETQMLKGELVLVYEKKGQWVRVACPDQQEYTHNNRWEGYPGWMRWSELTKDSNALREQKRPVMNREELRTQIVAKAGALLGTPYLWGGRSFFDPSNKATATGLDCSGLVNLSFLQVGIKIPRDAHEQYMKAHPVRPRDLKPADLVFLAPKEHPEKVSHVLLVVDEETLIEAPQTGERVRTITFRERLGKPRADIFQGDACGDRIVYFGSLMPEGQ